MLMRERVAATLEDFIGVAQVPINMPADPGGTSTFGAVLETLTHGVSGDLSVRTYIATQAPLGGFTPGQTLAGSEDVARGGPPASTSTRSSTRPRSTTTRWRRRSIA